MLSLLGGGRAFAQDKDQNPPVLSPVLTSPPKLLQAATPVYPEEGRRKGRSAVVAVQIRIAADGSVSDVVVLEPMGDGFDEAAIDAVKQYQFAPAQWDGVPGAIVVETAIHFVLQMEAENVVENTSDALPTEPAALEASPKTPEVAKASVRIEGVVLERGSRKRLAGVIVAVGAFGAEVVTDEEGRFSLSGDVAGDLQILAVDDDHERFERKLSLSNNESIEVKLYLRVKGGNPYETVVEGSREVFEVTRRRLHRQQLTTVPGTFGDPIRVIQSLPGLARTPFATGFLLIRGSNPDDSGVFLDGHRVPLLFHFLGGPSLLNPEFLESIDLYPGGFPARYGRSIGGIVAVDTRASTSDLLHGSVDIDVLDAGGNLRVPIGKHASFAIAGRRSYLDFMLGFFLPESTPGQSLVVVPVYDDQQIRLDYDFGKEGKASLFAIRSSDTLKVLSEDEELASSQALNTSIGFYRIMAKYERPLSRSLHLTLSPSFGTDTFSLGSGQKDSEEVYTGIDVQAQYLSYRMRVHGNLGAGLHLDAGLDMESRRTRYELFIPLTDDLATNDAIDVPPELLIRTVDALMVGAHADLGIDIHGLRIVPGLRVDGYYLSGTPQWTVDPRVIARYRINQKWLAKGYVGQFHQPPQPEALDAEFGNPKVIAEQALHVGVGAEWNFAAHWDLDVEGYFIDRKNQVARTDEVLVSPETGAIQRLYWDNTKVGDTVGIELLLRRQVTRRLFGWTSYTLSKTRDQTRPTSKYKASRFDQRHTLNVVASYTFNHGWELGSRFRLATGRPITEVVGSTFDADSGSYRPVEGTYRGERRKTFHQLDARVEKTWVFDTWKLGLYLDLQNVLNVSNEEGTQYDYRFAQRSPIQSVPFLPTLGVRGQF